MASVQNAAKMHPAEVLDAFRPPRATTASYVLIAVITAVAVLGTIPNMLGAAIVVPPAAAFVIADHTFREVHRKLTTCFDPNTSVTANPAYTGPSERRANSCSMQEVVSRVFGLGALFPAAMVYGVQLATNYFPAKLACATKIHIGSMLSAAAVPMGAMLLWSLVIIGIGLKPIIRGGSLSPLAATLADPLFVFGYILACSAAATLMTLQQPCQAPAPQQTQMAADAMAPLGVPQPTPAQYHHTV
jgi:hypothetical protein